MIRFVIPLDAYLEILRKASPEEHPWKNESAPEWSAVGEAFARMSHGMADFVDALRKAPGGDYEDARAVLEDMVHTFPTIAPPYIPDTPEALLNEEAGNGEA